jgi:hypothetical protein
MQCSTLALTAALTDTSNVVFVLQTQKLQGADEVAAAAAAEVAAAQSTYLPEEGESPQWRVNDSDDEADIDLDSSGAAGSVLAAAAAAAAAADDASSEAEASHFSTVLYYILYCNETRVSRIQNMLAANTGWQLHSVSRSSSCFMCVVCVRAYAQL